MIDKTFKALIEDLKEIHEGSIHKTWSFMYDEKEKGIIITGSIYQISTWEILNLLVKDYYMLYVKLDLNRSRIIISK